MDKTRLKIICACALGILLLLVLIFIIARQKPKIGGRVKYSKIPPVTPVIPKIDKQGIPQAKNNIAVIQPNQTGSEQIINTINAAYAKKHNLDYISYNPNYNYISYINQVMDTNPGYEYIIHISPLMLCTDFTKDIRRAIQQAGDNDMILCRNEDDPTTVSLDVVILRNSSWSQYKLRQIFWDEHASKSRGMNDSILLDQIYTTYNPYKLSDTKHYIDRGFPAMFSGICIYNEHTMNSRASAFMLNLKNIPGKLKTLVDQFNTTGNLVPDKMISIEVYPWVPITYGFVEVEKNFKDLPKKEDIAGSTQISKYIFQTMETTLVQTEMYEYSIKKWQELNPEYKYYYFDSLDCRRFIKDNFPTYIYMAYDKLIPGAYKSDFWRYCALYIYGGVYADSRTMPLVPLRDILTDSDHFCSPQDSKQYGLWQGFLCSSPKHQYISQAINNMCRMILSGSMGDGCLSITGPELIGRSVNKVLGRPADSDLYTIPQNKLKLLCFRQYCRPYIMYGNMYAIVNKYTDVINTHNDSNSKNLFDMLTGKETYSLAYINNRIYKFALPYLNTYTPSNNKGLELDLDKQLAGILFESFEPSGEIPERLSVFFYIDPNDVVLELGGNIGGVSEVIASRLNNGKNLVVVEPGIEESKKLAKLSQEYDFNIYTGPIVAKGKNILCTPRPGQYVDCKNVDHPVDNNITFSGLQKKFGLKFNTLVIDCEGCYQDILKEGISTGWLKNINKIIIEWDGTILEQELLNQGFDLVSTRYHTDLEYGVRVYKRQEE